MRTGALSALTLCSVIGTTACGGGEATIHYVQDENIPQEVRTEIHALNQRLLKSLEENDPSVMNDLLADEVKHKRGFERFDDIFASLRDWQRDTEAEIFHEFYALFSETGSRSWTLVADDPDPFVIQTSAIAERVYFSLLMAKSGNQDLLIGIEYIKPSDVWQVYDYRISVFRREGNSAVGWYRQARKLYEDRLLVPALVRMSIAESLLRPLPFLHYEQEKEMLDFEVQLTTELETTYGFPIELSALPSLPSILEVEPLYVDNELSLRVHYVSSLPFEEEPLKAEAESITPELVKLFPGFCDDIEWILYTIYSEPPVSETKRYLTYGVVTRCEHPKTQ